MMNLKKMSKIKNSKFQKSKNSTFVRIAEKKIQKKFEKMQKWFEGGVGFWSFGSHGVPVNENENYS